MIENYGFYNNHELDNTLLIIFSESKCDRFIDLGEMDVLYAGEDIVGYRFKNFIRYAKIKYSGIIYFPANPLIDIVNSILEKHHLEKLAYKKNSGYFTKKNEDKLMVFASEGTFLRDQSISKGKYCSYYDLDIKVENDHELFVIDENIREGVDFFKTEVK